MFQNNSCWQIRKYDGRGSHSSSRRRHPSFHLPFIVNCLGTWSAYSVRVGELRRERQAITHIPLFYLLRTCARSTSQHSMYIFPHGLKQYYTYIGPGSTTHLTAVQQKRPKGWHGGRAGIGCLGLPRYPFDSCGCCTSSHQLPS